MNFRQAIGHFGWMRRAIQIDHPYMFVPEVIESFLTFAGFRIVKTYSDEMRSPDELKRLKWEGFPGLHVLIVAERDDRTPYANRNLIRELYTEVRKSIAELPDSWLKFIWRFKIKRGLRKLGIIDRGRRFRVHR